MNRLVKERARYLELKFWTGLRLLAANKSQRRKMDWTRADWESEAKKQIDKGGYATPR